MSARKGKGATDKRTAPEIPLGKRTRFPAPRPLPTWASPPQSAEDHAMHERMQREWAAQDAVHRAVHVNEPAVRDRLARRIEDALLRDLPLHPWERLWLSWALGRLVETDTVPHLARGNAVKKQQRMYQLAPYRLAKAIADDAGEIIAAAAVDLHLSEDTVRKLWFDREFIAYADELRRKLDTASR